MPQVHRPDGVSIHYESRGEGPPAVLVPYWSWVPGVYENLLGDLAADHSVVTLHLRGTGSSTRSGPYDMETDTADLEAVLEAIDGGPAVLLCVGDAVNRATRLAVRRPDLAARVVAFGNLALPRSAFRQSESLVSSDTVIEAYADQLRRDFRAALRSSMAATNPQMTQDELQERVSAMVEHSEPEAAIERIRSWTADDPLELSVALGDRATMLLSERGQAGAWFPDSRELEQLVARLLPEARITWVPDGPASRPDTTAAAIRAVTART